MNQYTVIRNGQICFFVSEELAKENGKIVESGNVAFASSKGALFFDQCPLADVPDNASIVGDDYISGYHPDGNGGWVLPDLLSEDNMVISIQRFTTLLGHEKLTLIKKAARLNPDFKDNIEAAEIMMNARQDVNLTSESMGKYYLLLQSAGILNDEEIEIVRSNIAPD